MASFFKDEPIITLFIAGTVVSVVVYLSFRTFKSKNKSRPNKHETRIDDGYEIDITKLSLPGLDVEDGSTVRPSDSRQGDVWSLSNYSTMSNQKPHSQTSDVGHPKRRINRSIGQYKDNVVFVKQVPLLKTPTIKGDDMNLLKSMRVLNHDNVATFFGLHFTEDPGVILVFQYCAKESLATILFNDGLELDMVFKSSMARDVIRGLDYIHNGSILASHGRLTVNSCLVDGRWVVKLSQFGCTTLFGRWQDQSYIEKMDPDFQELFHMAPEQLRNASRIGTKEADIYSLGMVIYQILRRCKLYENMFIPDEEIVDEIRTPISGFIRPHLPADDKQINKEVKQLLRNCWEDNPVRRPGITQMRAQFREGMKAFNGNIIDHVLNMMERYARALEKQVEERTSELNEERKRADDLLSQMLPGPVATALKSGKHVRPETYDCVTVYFSDVVSFTKLSAMCTPIQVIDMLNGLYSMFDAIIKQCDAYKVETIGDAYMVCSGLPIRNGERHVFEIANMAIRIRNHVRDEYIIPHLPNTKLEIRIGFHSGPVAAGVVGMTMPRFCLFGDTVNTASRMESNSKAMRIHISETSKLLLEKSTDYKIQYRGEVELKGKGLQPTYWVDEVE